MKKCIVIGGGILGASTAYQLAKFGAEVVIVDRQDTGQATQAAAGIICPWISQRRNQNWYRLATAGARFYPELISELEAEGETRTGYARVGALSIHTDLAKLDKLEERARLRQPDAPEMGTITRLDQQTVRERFPLLNEGYEAVEISGAARVDGRELRDALLRSAIRHGAEWVEGDAVLQWDGTCVTGVKVDDNSYDADEVIVCAGAWGVSVFEPLGIRFEMHYQKAQIVHLQVPKKEDTVEWPVVMPPSTQYVLAFEDGRIVIGATHENDPDGYDTRVTAGGVQEVLAKGLEVAGALQEAELLEVRVGFRPFTPGFLPVLGRVPDWDGLLAANGLGASGLTMGPWIGTQLAKLALDLEPDMSLEDYSVSQVIHPVEAQ
ncbi:NAD(P)/FAD-dependent oxidoreductase [Paenibacillus daejeonensis]|uniref:NAD(P)/FAD-dependent oxidoreductase n=1 Tax=Paenibacillus daejeonensis TaxID=135193 RepID=UPI000373FC6D|nr:FAD-binding oxidoreductase [Paenibacillus daejeonensis]